MKLISGMYVAEWINNIWAKITDVGKYTHRKILKKEHSKYSMLIPKFIIKKCF